MLASRKNWSVLGSLSPGSRAAPVVTVLPFPVESLWTLKFERTENVPDTEIIFSGPEPELGLPGIVIFLFCLLSYVCGYFTYMYICVPHVCLVPREARREPRMLWNWSYGCELPYRCREYNPGPWKSIFPLAFEDEISLCRWPGIRYVDKTALKLIEIHVPLLSRVPCALLGLCSYMAGKDAEARALAFLGLGTVARISSHLL